MAAPWVVDDRLWKLIAPLLPTRPPSRSGPKPKNDRLVQQGILFVLVTGIGWEDLPQDDQWAVRPWPSWTGCRSRRRRN